MNALTRIAAPALAAALALSAAAPAAAAHFETPGSLRAEIARLDRQVNRAVVRHQLTRRDAFRLQAQVDRLEDDFRWFARGGFDRYELRTLDQRIERVKWQLSRQIGDDRFGHDGWREHRQGDWRDRDERGNDYHRDEYRRDDRQDEDYRDYGRRDDSRRDDGRR